MATLSKRQIASLWVQEGGPEGVAGIMSEIAMSESGGNTLAVSPTGCKGLYQLCPPPANWQNPGVNTRGAIAKYRASGFQPWTCCNPTAVRLVSHFHNNPALFGIPGGGPSLPHIPTPNVPDIPGVGSLLKGLQDIAGALDRLAAGAGAVFKLWLDLARKSTDPQTWIDAAKIAAGAVLLYLGAKRIFVLS